MKYKDILLATVISFAVVGCGDSSNLQETEKSYFKTKEDKEKRKKEEEQRIASSPRNQYIFGDTLKVELPDPDLDGGPGTRYHGIVSTNFRKTLNNIWSKLKSIGFSYNTPSDVKPLNEETELVYKGTSLYSPVGYQDPPSFYQNFITNLMGYETLKFALEKNLYTLINLKFKDRTLKEVRNNSNELELVLRDPKKDQEEWFKLSEQERVGRLRTGRGLIFPKTDSDVIVTQAQIDEWNQIFIDALAQDPFFSQFFRPQTLPDATGSVSLLAARTGKTGLDAVRLTVNGVPGSHMDLGLPVFVQLKGSVDQGKSTNLTTGTVAYKLGNTLVGAILTYSNSGSGFGVDGRQLETSIVASHSFGSFFIEGQLGSISATDVHFKDWSGSRAQLTVGIDTSWVSPFIQVSYRNLNNQSDTAVYGGLEVDLSEFRTDGYTVSTHLLTKAGYSNVKGTTGAVEWSSTLTLNSGVSFSTNFTLGTAAEPSAGLTFKLDH
jgi:hypothetical protein